GVAVVRTVPFQAASTRLTVIVSDLRFGVGKDPANGRWQAIEDFRWGDALESFLHAIDEAGRGSTDLVLDGDTFDLWQALHGECRRPNVRAGCTSTDAIRRLDRVLQAHAGEIDMLAAFARTGGNQLVIVPGDHDAALLFPAVAERVLGALAAPGHATVASSG